MTECLQVPNIYGVETEYTALLTLPGNVVYEIVGTCHSVNQKLGLYTEPKETGITHINVGEVKSAFEQLGVYMTSNGMLTNGGRFYVDPSGPEYDTPETSTAEEAVHRTFDGDQIVMGALVNLRESGALNDFQLNRRVVDHNRSSRGVHLNTTTVLPAEVPSRDIQEALYTLNVVKGSIFGSGGLLVDEKGNTAFHHSPRLSITDTTDAGYGSYKMRPLVRHPFKPDGPHFARVETVTSDALNFGWPLRASLVATNSLIRVLELGIGIQFPRLRDHVRAAHTVGQFGHRNQIAITRSDGKYVGEKPQRVLAKICEMLLTVDEKEGVLDSEAKQLLPEIIDVAERITKDPISVSTQVESVAREIAFSKKMEQKKVALDSETMCRFDYAWDWIGGGIAELLRTRNKAGWQGFKTKHSPLTAAKRRLTPPADTRASIRAEKIAVSGGNINADWMWVGDDATYLHPLQST